MTPWVKGSRFIQQLLIFINLATALMLILLALLRTHKILAQRRALPRRCRWRKRRALVTLESIGDGVITT